MSLDPETKRYYGLEKAFRRADLSDFGMSDDDVAPKIRITAYGDIPVRKSGQKFSEGAAKMYG